MSSSDNYMQFATTEMSVVADGLDSTVATLQPIGSTYMADVKLLSDAEELYKKQERSFCICKQYFCSNWIDAMRWYLLVPPWTFCAFICLFPALAFGPIEECLGFSILDCCCGDDDIKIPEESLKENAVSFFTTAGVVADTYFALNDKNTTSPETMLWPNILQVNVQKSRAVPRACGTCSFDFQNSNFFSAGNEGLSYYCDMRMGILAQCCSIMCVEQVVPNYSEVTFFSSPKGLDGMRALIDADPNLQSRCAELAKDDKTLLVGTDISKITIKGLKDVDQYTSDLQRVSARYRGGHPLSINLNKKTVVYNPDARSSSGGSGYSGDGGGGCGKQKSFMHILFSSIATTYLRSVIISTVLTSFSIL